ncbi:MAG TPA: hypothetical protein VE196_09665 [Pseudonocardiaceae bacterium]|nr:hypothetical protein [Pseudonocardiaceae bacterium]
MVGLVGGHQHRAAGGGEFGDHAQEVDLVAVVQGSGGLVEDEDWGLLDQGTGDQGELPLPPESPANDR